MDNNSYYRPNSKSQAQQDLWVCEMLNNKQGGFFVDIGAHDGSFLSNTFMLESCLYWSGICIEAEEARYKKLSESRKSKNINLAVRNYKGFCTFNEAETNPSLDDGFVDLENKSGDVPCDTIGNILKENGAPKDIDYISLDIEGLEYEVLSSFPFDEWNVNLWTIEHNLYIDGPENKEKIKKIMLENGYECLKENVLAPTSNGLVPFEDWFAKTK